MVELVSAGHPDKVADFISDCVVEFFLKENPNNKIACETLIKGRKIILAGEIGLIDPSKYDEENLQTFIKEKLIEAKILKDAEEYQVDNYLACQSCELSTIVENGLANDQCVVYGYAEKGISSMPIEYVAAYNVLKKLPFIKGIESDAKVLCDKDSIRISTSHSAPLEEVKEAIHTLIGKDIVVNPAGEFTLFGPDADCGVTGRKIVVDSYGTGIPVGGGAFSGKDFTKLDRSGAYYARLLALWYLNDFTNVEKVLVELSFMIGDSYPKCRIFNYESNEWQTVDFEVFGLEKVPSVSEIIETIRNEIGTNVTDYTWCPFMKLFSRDEDTGASTNYDCYTSKY